MPVSINQLAKRFSVPLTRTQVFNLNSLNDQSKKELLENSLHPFIRATQHKPVLSDIKDDDTEKLVNMGMPSRLSHPLLANNVKDTSEHVNVTNNCRKNEER